MTKPRREPDTSMESAKKKIAAALEKCKEEDVEKIVALSGALAKLKAVELKMSEGDWGAGLGGGE